MRQFTHELSIATSGKDFYDITRPIAHWVEAQGITAGLLHIFIPHTSASLLIQENADPAVLADLAAFFSRLAPERDDLYTHTEEGRDDMPAHIRAALTQTHLAIPAAAGKLQLGVWQAVYLFESRRTPHRRRVLLHLLGE